MEIGSSTVAFVVGMALVGAWVWNRNRWGRKSDEELLALANAEDWRHWQDALEELQRRGADLAGHDRRLAAHLLSDSPFEREAARLALAALWPEWKQDLIACGYMSTQSPEESRTKLAPLFAHFHVEA